MANRVEAVGMGEYARDWATQLDDRRRNWIGNRPRNKKKLPEIAQRAYHQPASVDEARQWYDDAVKRLQAVDRWLAQCNIDAQAGSIERQYLLQKKEKISEKDFWLDVIRALKAFIRVENKEKAQEKVGGRKQSDRRWLATAIFLLNKLGAQAKLDDEDLQVYEAMRLYFNQTHIDPNDA